MDEAETAVLEPEERSVWRDALDVPSITAPTSDLDVRCPPFLVVRLFRRQASVRESLEHVNRTLAWERPTKGVRHADRYRRPEL